MYSAAKKYLNNIYASDIEIFIFMFFRRNFFDPHVAEKSIYQHYWKEFLEDAMNNLFLINYSIILFHVAETFHLFLRVFRMRNDA